MLGKTTESKSKTSEVSVAGCLGYDVLAYRAAKALKNMYVSVAGCLGYDVLVLY